MSEQSLLTFYITFTNPSLRTCDLKDQRLCEISKLYIVGCLKVSIHLFKMKSLLLLATLC